MLEGVLVQRCQTCIGLKRASAPLTCQVLCALYTILNFWQVSDASPTHFRHAIDTPRDKAFRAYINYQS